MEIETLIADKVQSKYALRPPPLPPPALPPSVFASVRAPAPKRRGFNWLHLIWILPLSVVIGCALLGRVPEPPTTPGGAERSENDQISHDVYQLLLFGQKAKASSLASDYSYSVSWNGDHLDLYASNRDAANRLAKLACEQTFVGDRVLDLNKWNIHVLLADGSVGAECHIARRAK